MGETFSSFPAPSQPAPHEQQTPGSELAMLKQQAEALDQQIKSIQQQTTNIERGPNVVAKIDKDTCAGCGACVDACPCDAIKVENGVADVNEEECVGCGDCVGECPLDAIQVG